MRKRLTVLVVCLLLSISTNVFAAEAIETQLTLPKTYEQKAGDSYPMTLKMTLPPNYKRDFKTLSLSFLADKSLRIDSSTLSGPVSDNDYRLMTSRTDGSGHEITTLVIPDVKNLRGRELTLKLNGKFKPRVKGINEVKVSYVIGTVDGKGKARSVQKNQTSEKGLPGPSGLHKVDAIQAGDNTLSGSSVKGTRIRVFRGKTLIGSGVAGKDGRFSIVINPQPEGAALSFVFDSDKGKETVETKVGPKAKKPAAKNPSKEKIKDYVDVLSNANMIRAPHVDQLQVNAAIATAEFALAKDESYDGELSSVLTTLEEAMDVARPAYMSGYPDGTFGPKKPMTRAEVAAVFTRLINHGESAATFSSFKDIDEGKWYASSVGFMEKEGLIGGYKDGTFRPQKPITRAEFAKILAGFSGLRELDDGANFKDVKSNHWARGYIAAVERAGFMAGRGKGRFAPSDNITRQEVATAINKALGRRPNKIFLDTYATDAFKDVDKKMWSYYEILEATGQPE